MNHQELLKNIRIVMIETSHSGNIGAAARAMRVMGIYNLYLVNPKKFPSSEAVALASGATDVLENAVVVPTLFDAIKDCQLAFATTARKREITDVIIDAKEATDYAMNQLAVQNDKPIAFVFGTERTGMTNDQIALCQKLLSIPTENSYNSLNIAAAIQVLCYEIRQSALKSSDQVIESSEEKLLATVDEREGFFNQLESILAQTEFIKSSQNPTNILTKLRMLYNRRDLTQAEIHLLRGVLTEISKKIT